jgi:plastocyanin
LIPPPNLTDFASKIVMRNRLAVLILAAPLVCFIECGGHNSPSPAAADGLAAAPEGAVVINVAAISGALSFSPNPATVAGQAVSWHNLDGTVHRVVLDNGRLDTGNLGPSRFSAAMTLPAAGGYHCSIHPEMVGTLVTGQ